jgi:hypothetical protein
VKGEAIVKLGRRSEKDYVTWMFLHLGSENIAAINVYQFLPDLVGRIRRSLADIGGFSSENIALINTFLHLPY